VAPQEWLRTRVPVRIAHVRMFTQWRDMPDSMGYGTIFVDGDKIPAFFDICR